MIPLARRNGNKLPRIRNKKYNGSLSIKTQLASKRRSITWPAVDLMPSKYEPRDLGIQGIIHTAAYLSYNGSSRQGYTQHMERAVLRAKPRAIDTPQVQTSLVWI